IGIGTHDLTAIDRLSRPHYLHTPATPVVPGRQEGAMDLVSQVGRWLSDDRFTANLIAVHGILVVLILASLVLKRLLAHGSSRLKHWARLEKLDALGQEAVRHGHTLLFWLT